ncbi:hypothetical protein U9M48_041191, partial [Paspalum notatum var. saurae]
SASPPRGLAPRVPPPNTAAARRIRPARSNPAPDPTRHHWDEPHAARHSRTIRALPSALARDGLLDPQSPPDSPTTRALPRLSCASATDAHRRCIAPPPPRQPGTAAAPPAPPRPTHAAAVPVPRRIAAVSRLRDRRAPPYCAPAANTRRRRLACASAANARGRRLRAPTRHSRAAALRAQTPPPTSAPRATPCRLRLRGQRVRPPSPRPDAGTAEPRPSARRRRRRHRLHGRPLIACASAANARGRRLRAPTRADAASRPATTTPSHRSSSDRQ